MTTPRRWRGRAAVLAIAASAVAVAGYAASTRSVSRQRSSLPKPPTAVVAALDARLTQLWDAAEVTPAPPADDVAVLRRLSLALHGTVPSLEEIRSFEADRHPDRLRRRLRVMLAERRFADYFAERLARVWVGVGEGQFLLFRRDRFTRWLSAQLYDGRPFDDIVRQVIAADGLWTSEPAVNFVTAAVANDELDENALAARTVRAFLGQRIDCAQCHDHPFAHWKQEEFRGIAAFYGHAAVSFQGVADQPRLFDDELEYRVEDPGTEGERVVAPAVPFGPDCLPATGSRRDRLAVWVTHPDNARFGRATANRVWGLLFGRAYSEPVDDLPDPDPAATPDPLDLLGRDFVAHGYDLRRLIETIALSRPFRLDSAMPTTDAAVLRKASSDWAAFPLTRLRPEQTIGAMIQAARLRTIDRHSNLAARTLRFFRENDFIREYGDPGEAELDARSATSPQALLRMNGRLTRELTEPNPFSAAGRLATLAPDDAALVELCFLVTLTRRPSVEESAHFSMLVGGASGDARGEVTQDLLWMLMNSAEFSWNH